MPFDPSSLGSPRTDLGGDIVTINSADDFRPQFARRGGVGRKKQRTTIEIVSEPLLHDFDPLMLGGKPAKAIKESLERGIKAISEVASRATLERRKRARRHLEGSRSPQQESFRRRGARYNNSYEKRYSGGRIGTKMPDQTVRLFNDSNRLSEGLFVRQNPEDRAYTVNVPANRFTPEEFPGGRFDWMLEKLRSLVPALQDARRLLADPEVRRAIDESISDLITKAQARQAGKLRQLHAARKRAVLGLIRGFLGAG